ncbi:uncharacterized protein [Haliotis asinina]|uniref:uncharacterized protein n=1 Tax=Haliotis asinina TaxID=109174 RepID=UPI0035324081
MSSNGMNIMARDNKFDSVLRATSLDYCHSASQSLWKTGNQKCEVETPPLLDDMGGPSLEVRSPYSTPPPLRDMGWPSVKTRSPYSTPPLLCHMGGPSVEKRSPYSTPPPLCDMGGSSVETRSPYSTPPPLCDKGEPSVETRSPYSTPPLLCDMGGPSVETCSPYSTPPPLCDMGGSRVETRSPYSTPPPLIRMGEPSVETRSPYSTPPPLSHMGGPSLEAGSLQTEQRVPLSSHVLCAVRHKVMSDRRARGEGDIKVEFTTPVKHELTEEEEEKRDRRKRQNREAQHRSRLKKKRGLCLTDAELDTLMKANSALQAEVERLKRTVENLKRIEEDHIMSGQCVRYRQGQRLASQPGLHLHTDQCTTGYVGERPDNHEDTPNAGLPDQYIAEQASHHAYSPISDSCGSPCPDPQLTDMMDSQWMTTARNLEPYSVGVPSSMDEPGYPGLKVDGCDARPSCQVDFRAQIYSRQHTDRITSGGIFRDDAWLNAGVNRDTLYSPHDNVSRYSTTQTSDPVEQEAECRPLGEIGIPSLDNISLEQLIPANIDLSRYLPTHRN